jgi:hypothetical protein
VTAVFADTFYFLALINRSDQYHAKTIAIAQTFQSDIVTTEWVLVEFANALARSGCRAQVAAMIRDLTQDPRVSIVEASTSIFRRGLRLYQDRADKTWSLTDCISFAVMRDLSLRDALTGDRHFEQAGFTALLK